MQTIDNKKLKKLEVLYKLNKLDELEKETNKLLKIDNENIVLLNIIGVVYLKKNLFQKSEKIFIKILEKNLKNPNALKNLAETYRKTNNFSLAIKYYEIYLNIKTKDVEAINNIASCFLKKKEYYISIGYYRELIKIDPTNEEYLTNLAFALIQSLNITDGIEILEKVLDKNIKNYRAYSGYLQNQNFNCGIDFNKINSYIKKFSKNYERKKLNIVNFNYEKNPRKVNIGFISPDFRKHPVGYCIKSVIKQLKLHNVNSYGYYNYKTKDNLTTELEKDFDNFEIIFGYSNEQIINKIRKDGIHILIDLAGHTISNNLEIFYYKPAPIQMSWLGSMNTTGVEEIDYKIIDENIFSQSIKKHYTEKLLILPNIWTDYVVSDGENIDATIHQTEEDPITFGSFVALRKINNEVIKLWSEVLRKFPTTKIHFIASELEDFNVEKNLRNQFLSYGIGANRLILEKSKDHVAYLKSYSKVHISLDPFPFNAVTTSFESIWMGVPVFCLEGDTALSRCVYSINKNLNMNEWIAKDKSDYIYKLDKIISNKRKLILTKKKLRKHALENNLFNSSKFTKDFAIKLTDIWKKFSIE